MVICLDYSELNKVAVPAKYPIPVVEELLDELHEAVLVSQCRGYFSIHHEPSFQITSPEIYISVL